MPLKGALGLYEGRAPCLRGARTLWLDICGSLVQLWKQWIPFFMATVRAGNCKCGQSPTKISVILQQMTTGICCNSGHQQVASGARKKLLSPYRTSGLLCPEVFFWLGVPRLWSSETDRNWRRATTEGSSAMAQRNLFVSLASISSSHF